MKLMNLLACTALPLSFQSSTVVALSMNGSGGIIVGVHYGPEDDITLNTQSKRYEDLFNNRSR
ncbi:unnamed protein product [Taenia asiatica]|uniref:DUF5727 domain-containing protein n=1 Tax=Taenia asiatica TaxID=60517 RepID=A0A3P6QP70_TAEAS|nr:unnamed protein product [Taenia asiatica]